MPVDLHMEHLNRCFKSGLADLHSNVTEQSISRVGRSIRTTSHLCEAFEPPSSRQSGRHATPSSEKDVEVVRKCLSEAHVFLNEGARRYQAFQFKQSMLQEIDMKSIVDWVRDSYKNHY